MEKLIDHDDQEEKAALSVSHDIWQILEDSSKYAFNASHSYCVAIDSLYGAYLKSHYPIQFYTEYIQMHIKKGDKDKVASAIQEARNYFKIKILPYKYKQDNRQLTPDLENNAIMNDLSSIKGFGKEIGEKIYLASQIPDSSFMEVLLNLDSFEIRAAKVLPLIKIDYFSEYGNTRELCRMLDLFSFFKEGTAKNISKEKCGGDLEEIIKKYSTDKLKNGEEGKQYRITDMKNLLIACEEYVKSCNLEDFDLKFKIADQEEILGYISPTGNEKDRPMLLIKNKGECIRKSDGAQFGVWISCQSIGSGIQNRFTIFNSTYKKCGEFKKGQIIHCKKHSLNNGFYNILDYDVKH